MAVTAAAAHTTHLTSPILGAALLNCHLTKYLPGTCNKTNKKLLYRLVRSS